jgi:hypothetical protein
MGRIERRLVSLERLAQGHRDDRSKSSRYLDSYFRVLENLDRVKAGLPPLPYTVSRFNEREDLRLQTWRKGLEWRGA